MSFTDSLVNCPIYDGWDHEEWKHPRSARWEIAGTYKDSRLSTIRNASWLTVVQKLNTGTWSFSTVQQKLVFSKSTLPGEMLSAEDHASEIVLKTQVWEYKEAQAFTSSNEITDQWNHWYLIMNWDGIMYKNESFYVPLFLLLALKVKTSTGRSIYCAWIQQICTNFSPVLEWK